MTEEDILNCVSYVGQRTVSYTFTVVDASTGEIRGVITPLRGTSPSLSHDGTSTISRRIQGLAITGADVALYRPLIDRIELSMTIADAGTYPLGRYIATDDVRVLYNDGITGTATFVRPLALMDEMILVDTKMSDSFAAAGANVAAAIRALLAPVVGLKEPRIEWSEQISSSGWAIGASRATALTDLATAGGYRKPWFDHGGQLRVIRSVDPAKDVVTFDYDAYPMIYRNSITLTSIEPDAPNRFIVASNASSTQMIGIYDVPSSAPHSALNRGGLVIPEVLDRQVTSSVQARIYAETIAIEQMAGEKITFDTPPDPRHESFDVCKVNDQVWVETGWSLTLTPAGAMSHTLRRVYSASEDRIHP